MLARFGHREEGGAFYERIHNGNSIGSNQSANLPSRRQGWAAREFKPFSWWREAEKGTRRPAGKNSKVIWKGAMLVTGRRSGRWLGGKAEVVQNFLGRLGFLDCCDHAYRSATSLAY